MHVVEGFADHASKGDDHELATAVHKVLDLAVEQRLCDVFEDRERRRGDAEEIVNELLGLGKIELVALFRNVRNLWWRVGKETTVSALRWIFNTPMHSSVSRLISLSCISAVSRLLRISGCCIKKA